MEETLFYVFGLGLVLAAIVLSAVGLRVESFPPSRGALLGVVALFVVLVGGTTTFGVWNARSEQAHHEAQVAEAEQADEAGDEGDQPEGTAATGEEIFDEQGCGSCHGLEAVGSTGETGPNLDEALRGEDAAFIEESIVDPSAEVAEGYGDDIMPQTFEDSLAPEELDTLVEFLEASTQ